MAGYVRPLTYWVIHRQYRVRFARRSPTEITGVLTTPQGEIAFRYEPVARVLHLPGEGILINENGWEIEVVDEPE